MPMTTKILRTSDEIDAEYERTAPLKDLQFYLRYAERRLAELAYSPETITIIAEMSALEREIETLPTGVAKRRAWALIDRFKTSIPGWAGDAGAKGSWLEPIDSASIYWLARADLMRFEIEGKTKKGNTKTVVLDTIGPVSQSAVTAWYAPRLERFRRSGLRIDRLTERLDAERVRAIIDAVTLTPTENKPARKPRPETLVLACPKCSTPLVPIAGVAHTWGCAPCQETWYLAPVAQRVQTVERIARPKREHIERVPRVRPELTAAGEKTCTRCASTQPIQQFAWGAGHTIRNVCLTCRKQMQRDAAARRKQAA
jgi:hypothetical protein